MPDLEPIPAGTIALVVSGPPMTNDESMAIVRETGLTLIHLRPGETLEAMSEEDMGRAGWCRCPTGGFPPLPTTPPAWVERARQLYEQGDRLGAQRAILEGLDA